MYIPPVELFLSQQRDDSSASRLESCDERRECLAWNSMESADQLKTSNVGPATVS